jgi:hypothetical protein
MFIVPSRRRKPYLLAEQSFSNWSRVVVKLEMRTILSLEVARIWARKLCEEEEGSKGGRPVRVRKRGAVSIAEDEEKMKEKRL